ncbi:MAG: 7-cyano-7-deazaguanine synthase [Kiritimatiellae bacterium]|nr:7-cyano-7-deazaguanine synthase [Kiritimatiellia bacterium]
MTNSKSEIVKIGLDLGVNYAETWNCYRGKDTPCGVCPSCVERRTAFAALKISDPAAERMRD